MKVYKILLIIILILAIILGIRIYNDKKEPEYSAKEIKNILDKSKNIENYQFTLDNHTYKRKGKLVLETSSDSDITLIRDYETKKRYAFSTIKKTYIEDKLNSIDVYDANMLLTFQSNEFIPMNSTYIKKVKTRTGQFIKLKCNWSTNENVNIYVDLATGLIVKFEKENGEKKEINYSFDTVTDKDFEIPDISNYNLIKNGELLQK